MGSDRIHSSALKVLVDIIMAPLSIILQWSWQPGEIPVDWKLANVPVFKKGKKEDSGNYRPVSLTSVSGKMTEKIILRVIENYWRDNVVIGDCQQVFVRENSSLTTLISF